ESRRAVSSRTPSQPTIRTFGRGWSGPRPPSATSIAMSVIAHPSRGSLVWCISSSSSATSSLDRAGDEPGLQLALAQDEHDECPRHHHHGRRHHQRPRSGRLALQTSQGDLYRSDLTWLISLVRGFSGPDGFEDAGQVLGDVGWEGLRGAVDREGCG